MSSSLSFAVAVAVGKDGKEAVAVREGSYTQPLPCRRCWAVPPRAAILDEKRNRLRLLAARLTRLPKDSVANVSQVVPLDKALLVERVGKLPGMKLELLLSGLDVALGR